MTSLTMCIFTAKFKLPIKNVTYVTTKLLYNVWPIMGILKYSLGLLNKNLLERETCYCNHQSTKRNLIFKTQFLIHHLRHSSTWKAPKTPELIYVPHILRWLKTKLKFKYLQNRWDPEFSEGGFIYGTTHAICKVTEIISKNTTNDLNYLLTRTAKEKLLDDIRSLTPIQRKIIKLKPEDIKILVPLSVNITTNGVERRCSIDLRTVALRWFEMTGFLRLVLVALQSEFYRDYTKGSAPEWTINKFDILECTLLSEAAQK